MPEIDWEKQWEMHAKGFDKGLLTLSIPGYGDIRLKPGPGFGDLSHATTRLSLDLMTEYVKGREVIDIGCGSGILSLAASAMGAKNVVGIDIDSGAIGHSIENQKLNEMTNIVFLFPEDFLTPPSSPMMVMNMIRSEQVQAWEALSQLHRLNGTIITSGILTEDSEKYLAKTEEWGWRLVKTKTEDGWSAFVFMTE